MPPVEDDRKRTIQSELKRRGLSQQHIAEKAEVSETTVCHIIGGVYRPTTERGRRTERRVWQVIADAIDRPDLIPDDPAFAGAPS